MKSGLIIINAYSKLEHSLNQSKRLKLELEKFGISVDIKRNNYFPATVTDCGDIVSSETDYDFCVYLDKDKYASLMLEKAGIRLFNSHAAIQACDDKMMTAILLSGHGIPTPETLPGLLCYDPYEQIPDCFFELVENRLGYPLIIKSSYGSLGKGVYKIDNREEFHAKAEELKCAPHLFQRFIRSSFGRDIRVIMIGNQYAAAMIRHSNGDFRSNLELGGTGVSFNPPQNVIDICKKISRILDLDYCGIDILFGEEGYYICEVNSNAFFGGIESVTQVNIGHLYARYIYETIYGNLKSGGK